MAYTQATAHGLSATQLTDAGTLTGTDLDVINRAGTDLKASKAATATFVRQTPAGSRTAALPAVLTATDHDKIVVLTGTTGTLSADGTVTDGFECRILNIATGAATYSGITGLLGTTTVASGIALDIFKAGGVVYAMPPSGGSVVITTATAFTVTESATGGGIGTPITYTLTPTAGVWPSGEVITPANSGNATGAFSPTTRTPASNSSSAATFTFTPTGVGTVTANFTTTSSMTNSSGSLNYSVSSSPFVAVSSVTPVGVGITATASGTFANGAPASLSATMDGAGLSIAGIAISTTSGTGSTASGTWSFTFTNPAAGAHNLVVLGSGTYAGTSSAYSYTTATATIAVSTVTAPMPSTGFTVSGTYTNFTPAGLQYSYDSTNGTDGTWATVSSPSISGGAWSFSAPGLAAGSYKIWVRGTVYTTIFGGSNTFVVANAGGTITAPGSSTVSVPATLAVTVTGSGNPTVYASITSGGVEQTPRTTVPWGSTSISMTPTVQAASTASLYAASSGGTALATSGSFTPAAGSTGYGQVQGVDPSIWYDFSDGSTLFSDTGRLTPATGGGAVQGVADKSVNGIHLSQATTGNAPTLALAAQNGKSALSFVSASSQVLTGVAGSALTAMLAAFHGTSGTNGQAITFLIVSKASANMPATNNGSGGVLMGNSGALTTAGGIVEINTHLIGPYLAEFDRKFTSFAATDAFVSGNAAGIVVKAVGTYNSTTKQLTVTANSASVATGTGPLGTVDSTAWDLLAVGRNIDGYMNGQIMEFVAWQATASSTEVTALLATATTKWGS